MAGASTKRDGGESWRTQAKVWPRYGDGGETPGGKESQKKPMGPRNGRERDDGDDGDDEIRPCV